MMEEIKEEAVEVKKESKVLSYLKELPKVKYNPSQV